MTPNQTLNHLASVLFKRVNAGNTGTPIAVRLGYGNRLKVPAGLDQGNVDAGMSAGFISLWLNSSEIDCKANGFKEIEKGGETFHISEVISQARITVHAQRCNSFDLLHRLKMDFCHPAVNLGLHEDIFERPTFENIIDVTALSTGDEFEDRAESVLTVTFRDITARKLDCVTVCSQEITKPTNQTEQETLCPQ